MTHFESPSRSAPRPRDGKTGAATLLPAAPVLLSRLLLPSAATSGAVALCPAAAAPVLFAGRVA